MMKSLSVKLAIALVMLAVCGSVQAQGFLKKMKQAAEKVTKQVENVTGTTTEATSTEEAEKNIKWSDIPVYTAQKFLITDEAGQQLTNEDGTPMYRVFLVDQFGNKRSAAAVKAQQQKLNSALLSILAKVGGGALIGGLTGGKEGALTGAAAGGLASIDNIKEAKKQQKSLKQQEKLLAEYQQNFTEEGLPVDASVDTSKLTDLGLKEDNVTTITADNIKQELASTEFNTTDDSVFDF